MSFNCTAFVTWDCSAAVAVAALTVAATASADVSVGVQLGNPGYYQPAPEPVYVAPPPVYYQPAPPVYYQPAPPPVYYGPPTGYYAPPPPAYVPAPGYGYRQGYSEAPRLSDMQRRALDNCALLAPHERPRCRATVMSTTR